MPFSLKLLRFWNGSSVLFSYLLHISIYFEKLWNHQWDILKICNKRIYFLFMLNLSYFYKFQKLKVFCSAFTSCLRYLLKICVQNVSMGQESTRWYLITSHALFLICVYQWSVSQLKIGDVCSWWFDISLKTMSVFSFVCNL